MTPPDRARELLRRALRSESVNVEATLLLAQEMAAEAATGSEASRRFAEIVSPEDMHHRPAAILIARDQAQIAVLLLHVAWCVEANKTIDDATAVMIRLAVGDDA